MSHLEAVIPVWEGRLGALVRFERGFHHPARGACPMHAHALAELVFHPRGTGVTSNPQAGSLPFAPGDAVFYPAGWYHDQRVVHSDEDCCLQFDLVPPVPSLFTSWFVVGADDDSGLRDELLALSRCGRREDRHDGICLDLRLAAVLLRLCAQHRDDSRLASERLADRAHALIARRCGEDLSIPDIAAELGVGEDHLRHSFTRRHGISPLRHLIECRITRAKDLLAHAPASIRSVAEATGFANGQVFAASFRRETGMSPRIWRARYR